MRIEQAVPFGSVVEPGCVMYAVRSDGKGWSVVRAGGGIPVLVAESHRRHFAVQLDQCVVADIGVVDMAPCDDRIAVGVYRHRHAAAFAGMVGSLDIGFETFTLIIGGGVMRGTA